MNTRFCIKTQLNCFLCIKKHQWFYYDICYHVLSIDNNPCQVKLKQISLVCSGQLNAQSALKKAADLGHLIAVNFLYSFHSNPPQ